MRLWRKAEPDGRQTVCHAKFDPYGFALESFDVMGAYRTRYREADPDFAKLPPGLPRIDWTGENPVLPRYALNVGLEL